MFLFPIISENTFYILIHKYHNVNYFIFYIQYFDYLIIRGRNRFWKKSVVPLELPLPENLRFFEDSALSEGETAFGKNRLSPSDSPFPKIFAFIGLFYPLNQAYADNKVIDKDKKPYQSPCSKNAKRKSGYIKIK